MNTERAATADVRVRNGALVFAVIRDGVPFSRSEVVERTGLAPGTVRTIVQAFVANGLVTLLQDKALTGGRPTQQYILAPQRVLTLAVITTRHSIDIRLVDLSGESHWSESIPGGIKDNTRTIADICELVTRGVGAARELSRSCLCGVIISVPGLVYEAGTVLVALGTRLRDVDLASPVKQIVGDDVPVIVANDGRLRALAIRRRLCPEGEWTAVMTSGSDGISGALLDQQSWFGGELGLAGELGHLVIDHEGALCHCGNRGCLTTVASTPAICLAAQLPELVEQSDGFICSLPDASATLERLALESQPSVLSALDRAGSALAGAIGSLTNTLNIGRVILAGDFAQLATWLRPQIDAAIAHRTRTHPLFNPQVLVDHGPECLWDGAALIATNFLAENPFAIAKI